MNPGPGPNQVPTEIADLAHERPMGDPATLVGADGLFDEEKSGPFRDYRLAANVVD